MDQRDISKWKQWIFDPNLNNDGIFIRLSNRASRKGNCWKLHEIAISTKKFYIFYILQNQSIKLFPRMFFLKAVLEMCWKYVGNIT